MPSFWKHVNAVLKEADIIIEVLDARSIEETRNVEIERKVKKVGKKLLFVANKCDLVNIKELQTKIKHLKPVVFISSHDHLGTTILKKKILELSRGEGVTVGIVGYPNVGKSSLINALAGKGKARTSSESGFTKGLQKIRVDRRILLLDTPGVFPEKEKDIVKHGKTGAVDYSKLKDPEVAALHLLQEKQELLSKHYNLTQKDPDEMLEELAQKFNKLRKGGYSDLEATARFLLKEWQTGKIVENPTPIKEIDEEKPMFRVRSRLNPKKRSQKTNSTTPKAKPLNTSKNSKKARHKKPVFKR